MHCKSFLFFSNNYSKLVKTFKSAKFTVVFSKSSFGGYGNEFNLKDEGIEIEKYYVNDGFAEYQHDIGNSFILEVKNSKITYNLYNVLFYIWNNNDDIFLA